MPVEIDLDRVREEYQRAKERQSSGKIFRPEPGRNVVRLIPPKGEKEIPSRQIGIHYGLGTGAKQRAFCPAVEGKPCPVCEFVERNRDTQLARKLAVKTGYFFSAIVRGQEELGPRILQVGTTVWMPICELLLDPEDPVPLIDPEDGYDLIIVRDGEGLQTKYTVRTKPKPSRLGDEAQIREWTEQQANLDEVVSRALMVYEELQALVPDSDSFPDIKDDGIPFN